MAGLSQEELAAKLGLKPQQIQRYEATEYQAASLERVHEIVRVLRSKSYKAGRVSLDVDELELLDSADNSHQAWVRLGDRLASRCSSCSGESNRRQGKAKRIIFGYQDKEFSYCDATSFAVMERRRIRQVMAFDPHFTQHGKFVMAQAQD